MKQLDRRALGLFFAFCALSFGAGKCKGYDTGNNEDQLNPTNVARVTVDGVGALTGAALTQTDQIHLTETSTSACQGASSFPCSGTIKAANYDCQVGTSDYRYKGSVKLTYNT